jgi:DNA-binding transcriptional ArsR family regulator
MNDVLTPLKAVSEEIRIRILLLLAEQEACVCELMAVFNMAQSKLSHHLITLRDAGLLHDDRRGRWNYYRVDVHAMQPARRELLASLSRWLEDDTVIEKDRKKLEAVKAQMGICC